MSIVGENDQRPGMLLGTDPDPEPRRSCRTLQYLPPGTVALAGDDALVADSAAPALSAFARNPTLRLVWRRFRRNKLGMTGAIMVAILLLVTVFADFVSPYDRCPQPRRYRRPAADAAFLRR